MRSGLVGDLPRVPRPARPPSLLPDSDREWLARLIRTEIGRVERALAELQEQVSELDRRQLHDARNSAATNLEQQRELAALWQRVGARAGAEAGATAGHDAATAAGRKWGAVMAGIALLTTLVNAALGRAPDPPPPPSERSPQVQPGRP